MRFIGELAQAFPGCISPLRFQSVTFEARASQPKGSGLPLLGNNATQTQFHKCLDGRALARSELARLIQDRIGNVDRGLHTGIHIRWYG